MAQEIKVFDSLFELLEDLDRNGITGMDRRRHMANFLMRKSRLHGRPYCASFELTPLCNFDCKMCYMHLTVEQMQKEGRILTTEEWLDIARQTVEAGVQCIDITGGECLTHPGFRDIYTYLVGRGLEVSVLTNGQLITKELVDLFVRYKPVVVQISLYGSDPEAYLRVTGRDAFHDVMSSIHMLREAGVRMSLSITPHRYMQEDSAKLLDLVHSLNIDHSIGASTLPARPETGRNMEDYIIDNAAYVRLCKMETEHRKSLAKDLSLTPREPYYFRIKGQESFEGAPCMAGSANFHINWKGEMTPCIAYFAVRKSVLDIGIWQAWNWIRDTMKQYRPPEECAHCDLQKICTGCPAERTAGVLNGSINPLVCKWQRETMLPDMERKECIQKMGGDSNEA